jgi:hypothetical protein
MTDVISALLQLRRAVVETPDERFDYRTQERGVTYQGIADAMADQWAEEPSRG